jgi:rhodanese-related sulfurtransferase
LNGTVVDFLQQNMMWAGLAVISGGMLLWTSLRGGGSNRVSPLQATLLINREDALVVDVREANEYAAGHLPHARHIPLGAVEKRAGELEKHKTKPLIVVCQSGNRSGSACSALRKSGFEKVFNLSGGMVAWEQAGLPVTKR